MAQQFGLNDEDWVFSRFDTFSRPTKMSGFQQFFQNAMGSERTVTPYPYQTQFATLETLPHLLRVPTSAGKTATAILGWLYRRQTRPGDTPRRLAYCLPMRVLVEQSERESRRWIANLGLDIQIHVLMGGVEASQWYLHPEKPAILIGTQDMLLSRALNRGYAASRFHWPIDFGLLNNDCLWVLDEPQLMGSGVSTSAQLAGLRRSLDTIHACPSVWMSATLEPGWLDTVDFRGTPESSAAPLELGEADFDPGRPLFQRMTAVKTLAQLDVVANKDMKDLAKAIVGSSERPGLHRPDSETLVIVNTVDRAKAVFDELSKLRKNATAPSLLLIHSRFRPTERRELNAELCHPRSNRIIVATQVVEAGVDLSARTLVTELAPWPSLVQRIGRCNRTGHDGHGQVFWIDLDETKQSPPYSETDLRCAREYLRQLNGKSVSPRDLDQFKQREHIVLPFEHKHVLRRRDLMDLFDTTPDLSGNDVDIQRFVRGDDPETDVHVFWREIDSELPSADEPAARRDELCAVPIGQVRECLESRVEKRRLSGFVWDHLDERWLRVDPRLVRPGMTIMLPSKFGGYDWDNVTKSGRGWDLNAETAVSALPHGSTLEEGAGSDPISALAGPPLTISEHTANVCREMESLLETIDLPADWRANLTEAVRWHDVGKSHWAFQQGMRSANPSLSDGQLWAKSGATARLRHGRKHFRHELSSALAAWQHGFPYAVSYLIASHHGRVRLSIRALPGEVEPDSPSKLFALGNHHGDELPEVDIAGKTISKIAIDLTPMQLGGDRSWTANALALLAGVGPFRLAYFEALLRIADFRASQMEAAHD
jgi:CRISPR-associated endonuclease/helicase Cas3